MKTVGFIGWRGMVGQILFSRLEACHDFEKFDFHFFSTSQAGEVGPEVPGNSPQPLKDAFDLKVLSEMDIILTCQGSEYTKKVFSDLREQNWQGYWVDAASALRMEEESCLCLDPINADHIHQSLEKGVKNYIGANCTVSLLLMAIGGLFKADKVEWVSSMTYQAASGGGAKHMKELLQQTKVLGSQLGSDLDNPYSQAIELERKVDSILRSNKHLNYEQFKTPLAMNLIPWIDSPIENGQTREEWKAFAEGNKILNRSHSPIPLDGICVRVSSLRCHSQALTIKLKDDLPISEIEKLIEHTSPWTKIIPNTQADTLEQLAPKSVSGTLDIPVGRIRKLNLGPNYVSAFTVGDQLLWGAAEPIRRVLGMIIQN